MSYQFDQVSKALQLHGNRVTPWRIKVERIVCELVYALMNGIIIQLEHDHALVAHPALAYRGIGEIGNLDRKNL